ncbi:hypothetical protein HY449_01010 [Candidatus Pacearchaeota archaeon]|nr:hypothetical protein [Candidatus Pacearchaeota archaeon]
MSELNFYEVEGNFLGADGTDIKAINIYETETPRQAIRIASWRDGLNLDAKVSMRKIKLNEDRISSQN